MTAATKPILTEELRKALAIAGVEIRRGFLRPDTLDRVVTLLDRMPAADAVRADRQIAHTAGLFVQPVLITPRTLLSALFGGARIEMPYIAGAEYLFVFHFSGYVREEALRRFRGGLRSPFFFAALAYRLNDWVPEVRQAAKTCAARTFPLTDPAIVAEAAIGLLDRRQSWRRWSDEAGVLDEAISRPDVLACLVARIRDSDQGPMASVLRSLLRGPAVDGRLPELAAEAVQPSVRATAVQALIKSKTMWPAGYRRQWINKPNGIYRRLPIYEERPLSLEPSRDLFVALAARDRSAAVRRIAATSLIEYRASLSAVPEMMRLLANDRSPAVRERIEFLARQLQD